MTSNLNLTVFGHLPGCSACHIPNRLEPKPKCPYLRAYGERCGKQVALQGCVHLLNGENVGMCSEHYRKFCNTKDWYHGLSECANKRCDALGLSWADRYKISAANIKNLLGLPAKVRCQKCCFGRLVSSHHLKIEQGTSRKVSAEPPAKKMRMTIPIPVFELRKPEPVDIVDLRSEEEDVIVDLRSSDEEVLEVSSESKIVISDEESVIVVRESSESSISDSELSFSADASDDELGSDDDDVIESVARNPRQWSGRTSLKRKLDDIL